MERVNTGSEKKQQELLRLKNKYSNEFPSMLTDYLEQQAINRNFTMSEIEDCYRGDYDEWVADLFELANC